MGLMDGLALVGGSARTDERWRRGFRFFMQTTVVSANVMKSALLSHRRDHHSGCENRTPVLNRTEL